MTCFYSRISNFACFFPQWLKKIVNRRYVPVSSWLKISSIWWKKHVNLIDFGPKLAQRRTQPNNSPEKNRTILIKTKKKPKFFFDFTRVNRPYLGSPDRAFNPTNKPVMTEKTCQPRTMEKNWLLGSQVYNHPTLDHGTSRDHVSPCFTETPWILCQAPWLSHVLVQPVDVVLCLWTGGCVHRALILSYRATSTLWERTIIYKYWVIHIYIYIYI